MDERYDIIKTLIETGKIKSFPDIFRWIPKTVVYRDLQVNFNRFSRAILNPAHFTLQELMTMAEFFCIDAKKMIDMAYVQALIVKNRNKRKQNK